MQFSVSQLQRALQSLPDFEDYPGDTYKVPLMEAATEYEPKAYFDFKEITFRKNYHLHEWVIEL